MSVHGLEIPIPADYRKTGDHALILAWVHREGWPQALLCLEDGSPVLADLDEFKFDYRYDVNRQAFVDVSGIPLYDEEPNDDADQEPANDGSAGVPGLVSEAAGASPGDPG